MEIKIKKLGKELFTIELPDELSTLITYSAAGAMMDMAERQPLNTEEIPADKAIDVQQPVEEMSEGDKLVYAFIDEVLRH